MLKKDIGRKDLKGNILRKMIIRIDYKGIIDLENSIESLEEVLFSDFKRLEEEYISENHFDVKDPEPIETLLIIPVQELRKIKMYSFMSEDKTLKLEISKFFARLQITYNEYREFEYYGNVFCEIMNRLYKKNNFLRGVRFGVRKINSVYFSDLSIINNYLEKDYFSNITNILSSEGFKTDVVRSELIDSLDIDGTLFNIIRYIDKGEIMLDKKWVDAYQTVIDIDGYIRNEEVITSMLGDNCEMNAKINMINENIFKVFKQTLTEEFLNMLIRGETRDKQIGGVILNG